MASSSYPYNQLKTQKDAIDARAKSSIQKAKKEEQSTRLLDEDLRKAKTTQVGDNTPLLTKFQEFIYGVKNVASGYNVDITAIVAKDGRSLSSTARELTAVAVPLAAAPGVKVITIELRGKVKSVDNLKKFLGFLTKQNISLSNITMARDGFTLTVDIYGV